MESALVKSGVQSIDPELLKYLSDMFAMVLHVIGVNEDVVQVGDDGDI